MAMKLLSCFPRRRRRIAYSVSSTVVYYRNSPSSTPVVTFRSRLSSSNKQVASDESLYESINCSSGDGTIVHPQTPIEFQDYGGYATIISKSTQPKPVPMDETGLYAIIDKSRQAKNRLGPQTNSAIAKYTTNPVPPLPPLSTLPLPIPKKTTGNTITNARYELPSAPYPRPQHLFNPTGRRLTATSDLYAEIANGSPSGTINPSLQSSPSPRSFTDSGSYVTLPELAAALTETDNTRNESNITRPVKSHVKYERF